MNPHILELKANNSINASMPNSFMTSDDNKSPLMKDESDITIKHPKIFKISIDKLVCIVKEVEKRTFAEEIDKLEFYGCNIFYINIINT